MTLAGFRDVAIIVLATLAVVQTLLIIVLAVVLLRTTMLLRGKAADLLDRSTRTVGTVESTVSVVSDVVLKPLARMVGAVSGVRRVMAVLTGISHRRRGR
ncbi:MAG: hypothetical protein HYY05_08050 [Chloroflexi bacterium]|nr:hypothetical protein [Chloroflexota bacterium]